MNTLLQTYQEISEHIPLLEQYEQLRSQHSHLQQLLVFIYKDILEFHRRALKVFRQPGVLTQSKIQIVTLTARHEAWKQLFHATWKTFRANFDTIISNLDSHRKRLDSQALVVGVQETIRTLNELREIRQAVQAKSQEYEEEDQRNRRCKVVSWLSAADIESDHDGYLEAQQESGINGEWLFEHNIISSWADRNSICAPLLWINGKPGAGTTFTPLANPLCLLNDAFVGKTILASALIEKCRSQPNSPVAFFYCKHKDNTRDNFVAFARSIISQLSKLNPLLDPFILDTASSRGTNVLQSPETAKEILNVALESFAGLRLIIDGLDECSKSQKEKISSWTQSAFPPLQSDSSAPPRCCFVSQHDNDTGRLFKSFATFEIKEHHNRQDIENYCKAQATEISADFSLSSDDVKRLREAVTKKADGKPLSKVWRQSNSL